MERAILWGLVEDVIMVSMSSEGVVDVGVDAEAAVGFPSLAALPRDRSRVRTVGFSGNSGGTS
jgi:hypothetical protein